MPLTEAQFSALPPEAQATLRAGVLMQAILQDAEAAKTLTPLADKAAKKLNPSHQTAEEVAAPFVAAVRSEFTAELTKRDKQAAEERATTELQSRIATWKSDHSLTDEGVTNILKTMQDKGVADFDIAAKAYMADHPTPEAAPQLATESMNWNAYESMRSGDQKDFFFPEGNGIPTITENPEVWEKEQALRYLNNRVSLPTS